MPSTTENAALTLSWCFGFNKDIIGGVHSLADDTRHAIFYVAAHTGVIYDYANRTQRLLQGHCNPISCCAVSEDKRWIVTADAGKDCVLVVWDSVTGNPIKTIFTPHPHGVQAIDISPDAMFLATLSHVPEDSDRSQEVAVWEWTAEKQDPLCKSAVSTKDINDCIRFNSYDIREIVTSGKQRVIFWNWTDQSFDFYSPPLVQKDFGQAVGAFTHSMFIPDSPQAVTATVDGDVIVWDVVSEKKGEDINDKGYRERKAVKIIRVTENDGKSAVSVNCMTDIDGYLVICSDDGAVRFYDFEFRLVAWFEDLNAGPVTSISFGNMTPSTESGNDSTFVVPKFVVGTRKAFIVGVDSAVFAEYSADKRRGTLLVQGIDDEVHGLAAHPLSHHVALSCYSGAVQLWDFNSKRLMMMRQFDAQKMRPQSIAFSPNGFFLAVGFTNGVLKILHATSFEDMATFRESTTAITDVRFSHDSYLLAVADTQFHVALWRYSCSNEKVASEADEWVYLGRHRSHTQRITGLEFSENPDGDAVLISVGEDRNVVEYNLSKTSVTTGVLLNGEPRKIEQSGILTGCFWHPEMNTLREDLFVVVNDEYKIKQWNFNNRTCRKTTLGPTYGGPITRVLNFPQEAYSNKSQSQEESYCAYSTADRVIGLMKLPFDGNPNKSMGLIAHPGEISAIQISSDGKFVFTAGGKDLTVNMWNIDTSALDLLEAGGGIGIQPFLAMIEGGENGDFHNEIIDYFYYAQLRTQGEDATKERAITKQIPLSEVPQAMRALGFYPSDEQIQHICSEMKYKDFAETTKTTSVVGLDDLIKLYINHRPVFGVDKEQIDHAFSVLGANPTIDWTKLQSMLLNSGEKMTQEELKKCLNALVAESDLPQALQSVDFADKVLGFEDYDTESIQQPQTTD